VTREPHHEWTDDDTLPRGRVASALEERAATCGYIRAMVREGRPSVASRLLLVRLAQDLEAGAHRSAGGRDDDRGTTTG